jgi:uncharacterized membrane protein (UPF0127 family)
MSTTVLRAAYAVLLLGAAAATAGDPAAAPLDLSTWPRAALEVVQPEAAGPPRKFRFDVWVADTPERGEQGLMFVRDLPAERGMIFPFPKPRVVTFWMKNTYIELDMLFIAAGGRVVKIIDRAPPLRLDLLSSDVPVAAVLELRGGEAGLLGLKVGDRVSWKTSPALAP